ncbi:MAG: DUF2459 domain-containing protein [Pirellulaceae bacterium]|nr:DUF2459 domain-containing protein [Pirellulaceae bacterium]
MNSEPNNRPRPTIVRRVWGWLKRAMKVGGLLFATYLLILLVGLFPLNNDYDVVDWRTCFPVSHFAGDVSSAKHLVVGWGDRGFFVDTERWSDLKVSTALHALWSNDTVLHVSQTEHNDWETRAVKVRISAEQYSALVRYVRSTLADVERSHATTGDFTELLQKPVDGQLVGARYGENDAFYHAHGRYHVLNTCNSWVGNGLRQAGVRVGAWTPLPKTVYFYLPNLGNND